MFWLILQVLSSVLFGICIKMALNTGIDPVKFSYEVFFVSIILIGAYGFFTKGFKFNTITKNDVLKLFLVGFLVGGVLNIVGFLAYKYASLTNVAFLTQANVLFAVIFGILFLNEKRFFKEWCVIGFLFLGLYLFATNGKGISISYGDILVLFSALGSALLMFGSQIVVKTVDPVTYGFIRAILIFFAVFLYALFFGKIDFNISYFRVILQAIILSIGIISLNKSLTLTTASQVAIINLSIPIITSIFAYFIFGDKITLIQIIGALIIIISIYLLQKFRNKEKLQTIVQDEIL